MLALMAMDGDVGGLDVRGRLNRVWTEASSGQGTGRDLDGVPGVEIDRFAGRSETGALRGRRCWRHRDRCREGWPARHQVNVNIRVVPQFGEH